MAPTTRPSSPVVPMAVPSPATEAPAIGPFVRRSLAQTRVRICDTARYAATFVTWRTAWACSGVAAWTYVPAGR